MRVSSDLLNGQSALLRYWDDAVVSDSRLGELVMAAGKLMGRRLRPVAELGGGQHALTLLARTDGDREVIVRLFPAGDRAGEYEAGLLGRLAPLGALVPDLISYSDRAALGPIIITTKVDGTHPAPTLPVRIIAHQMALALAKIHQLSGAGLRSVPVIAPDGSGTIARAARKGWPDLSRDEPVLTHYDFWCGNALWVGSALSGVVDWSGARNGPRGVDLAWCRLDLVLLGCPDAATGFLRSYEGHAGVSVSDIRAWDLQAAAQAEDCVQMWAPNYRGIGRGDLTPEVLRTRLSEWSAGLLERLGPDAR